MNKEVVMKQNLIGVKAEIQGMQDSIKRFHIELETICCEDKLKALDEEIRPLQSVRISFVSLAEFLFRNLQLLKNNLVS